MVYAQFSGRFFRCPVIEIWSMCLCLSTFLRRKQNHRIIPTDWLSSLSPWLDFLFFFPEANSKSTWNNGWLEDEISFRYGPFSGAFAGFVSARVDILRFDSIPWLDQYISIPRFFKLGLQDERRLIDCSSFYPAISQICSKLLPCRVKNINQTRICVGYIPTRQQHNKWCVDSFHLWVPYQ